MRRSVRCVSIVAAIVLAPSALAVTRNVPAQHATIQAAITASADGDVIIVAPGTYGPIDLLGKAITVRSSAGPLTTFIQGSGSVVKCTDEETNATIIDGFTIRNGTGTSNGFRNEGGGVLLFFADPSIRNCIIRDNTASAGGGIFAFFSSPRITNCLVFDNVASAEGGGMSFENQSGPIIFNTTITQNTSAVGGGVYADMSQPLFLSSIIWSNDDDAIANVGFGGAIVRFSNIQNGYSGQGNIGLNPLFTNPAANDFTLQLNSPSIDSGDSMTIALDVPKDILGAPRAVDVPTRPDTGISVFALTVDMGAFERQVAPAASSCPGDLTGTAGSPDGTVNAFDLLQLLGVWGACP